MAKSPKTPKPKTSGKPMPPFGGKPGGKKGGKKGC